MTTSNLPPTVVDAAVPLSTVDWSVWLVVANVVVTDSPVGALVALVALLDVDMMVEVDRDVELETGMGLGVVGWIELVVVDSLCGYEVVVAGLIGRGLVELLGDCGVEVVLGVLLVDRDVVDDGVVVGCGVVVWLPGVTVTTVFTAPWLPLSV